MVRLRAVGVGLDGDLAADPFPEGVEHLADQAEARPVLIGRCPDGKKAAADKLDQLDILLVPGLEDACNLGRNENGHRRHPV